MRHALPIALIAMLSGCATVTTDQQIRVAGDNRAFDVVNDDMYYWPASFDHTNDMGETEGISVFPIITALVVSLPDGTLLTEADESTARAAASRYCADRDLPFDDATTGRFSEGTWAFPSCAN